MKLHLDLAHAQPRPSWLGWLLLALGIAAAAWAGWRYQSESARLESAQARLQAVMPARSTKPRSSTAKSNNSVLGTQAQRALHANWSGLLARLEQERPKEIALISLEVDAVKGGMKLAANAKDLAAMLSYLDQLKAHGFSQVRLDKHEAMEGEGESFIHFTLHLALDKAEATS